MSLDEQPGNRDGDMEVFSESWGIPKNAWFIYFVIYIYSIYIYIIYIYLFILMENPMDHYG
jgi:hypothetical protein